MRLTQFADYGLRALIFLGCHMDRRVPTAEISSAYGISHDHLQKIVRLLGELGVVTLHRGKGGGLELACPPADISIGKVLRQLEGDTPLVECFEPDRDECVISPTCGLKAPLGRAQNAFYAELDRVTLAQVLDQNRTRLRTLLGS